MNHFEEPSVCSSQNPPLKSIQVFPNFSFTINTRIVSLPTHTNLFRLWIIIIITTITDLHPTTPQVITPVDVDFCTFHTNPIANTTDHLTIMTITTTMNPHIIMDTTKSTTMATIMGIIENETSLCFLLK
nr:PREDICTED: uncharacterized protein LOC103314086 [Tribolium castaneum]|eukprot:XP_008197208.1 PREDICTED: uncharacterized protein LOC103314086 [Tribolium castaneum]